MTWRWISERWRWIFKFGVGFRRWVSDLALGAKSNAINLRWRSSGESVLPTARVRGLQIFSAAVVAAAGFSRGLPREGGGRQAS